MKKTRIQTKIIWKNSPSEIEAMKIWYNAWKEHVSDNVTDRLNNVEHAHSVSVLQRLKCPHNRLYFRIENSTVEVYAQTHASFNVSNQYTWFCDISNSHTVHSIRLDWCYDHLFRWTVINLLHRGKYSQYV